VFCSWEPDGPPSIDGYPAKHLFGFDRVSSPPAEANRKRLPARDSKGSRDPETQSSQPRGYPFKLKAAASVPEMNRSKAPVRTGPAAGADTR